MVIYYYNVENTVNCKPQIFSNHLFFTFQIVAVMSAFGIYFITPHPPVVMDIIAVFRYYGYRYVIADILLR